MPVDLDLFLSGSGTTHSLRLDLDPLVGSGSSHSLGVGFDPLAAINEADDSINLGYVHGFTQGQQVMYSHGGDKSIGGLQNKGSYYAIVESESPTVIRLAESQAKAITGTYIDLGSSNAQGISHSIGPGFGLIPVVDGDADTIGFQAVHGFGQGQSIVYDSGGGMPIGGLTSGESYYVNSIDPSTIKLARSVLEAMEDEATFFSPQDLDNTGDPGTMIDLGYVHGFKTGDAVVYRNGGGTSIGGLHDGQSYYVLFESDTEIKLSESAVGTPLVLDTTAGDGESHTLRLALDPREATGMGHRLFEPDDVDGSFASVGKTTISATNTGQIVTVTLAASKTGDDKLSAIKDANAKEAKRGDKENHKDEPQAHFSDQRRQCVGQDLAKDDPL